MSFNRIGCLFDKLLKDILHQEEKTQRYTTERHKSGRIVADKTADTDCPVQDPLVEGESEEVPT